MPHLVRHDNHLIMFHRLDKLKDRFGELQDLVARPDVIRDQQKFQQLTRELSRITPLVDTYGRYQKVIKELQETEGALHVSNADRDMVKLYQEELERCNTEKKQLEQRLEELLLESEDENEGKNVIVEIRAGTGGEEAALFAADLFRMYSRWASDNEGRLELMSSNPTGIGGFKEIIFSVSGAKAYRAFRFESGTHRVQRVPATEASGRIHTSAVTVAVLPEAEEVEVDIQPKDLRIDVFRSGGPGGQSVNTTDSAVRVTHIPSGLVVSCQDEKSQHKNKAKALRILRTRLFDLYKREQQEKIAKDRREQVGSGDRSERIRTYNFPDNRVTDHRIGLTLHNLGDILEGHLADLFGALEREDRQKRLVGEKGIL
jgi:peptide chain release factor 1